MVNAASTTRLAYVQTGIAEVDQTSRAGLAGLGQVLARRTAVETAEPLGVDPAEDELIFFPLLYWPVVAGAGAAAPQAPRAHQPLSCRPAARSCSTRATPATRRPARSAARPPRSARLRASGRRDQDAAAGAGAARPRADQVFYLLHEFPGRWNGGTVWIEPVEDRVNDGVSSVIVGGNDWAGAWAVDGQGRPPFPWSPAASRSARSRCGSASTS